MHIFLFCQHSRVRVINTNRQFFNCNYSFGQLGNYVAKYVMMLIVVVTYIQFLLNYICKCVSMKSALHYFLYLQLFANKDSGICFEFVIIYFVQGQDQILIDESRYCSSSWLTICHLCAFVRQYLTQWPNQLVMIALVH